MGKKQMTRKIEKEKNVKFNSPNDGYCILYTLRHQGTVHCCI